MMREWLMSLIREAVRAEIGSRLDFIESTMLQTGSDADEIKEVLLEASRIKAKREAGLVEEIKPRQPVRQRAFLGISQRRAAAENASLEGKTRTEQLRANDIKAMEER